MPLPESAYPLAAGKDYQAESLFRPEHLLREARRQKQLPQTDVPAVALLDPDGDIARFLRRTGRGRKHQGWACYHTDMWVTDLDGWRSALSGAPSAPPSPSWSPSNWPSPARNSW
jgi:hypothetical protein